MVQLRRPEEGQRLLVNVAGAFVLNAEPVWIEATVEALLATQFTWKAVDSDRTGFAFYVHHDETWKEGERHV